jgi:hypothetical protein
MNVVVVPTVALTSTSVPSATQKREAKTDGETPTGLNANRLTSTMEAVPTYQDVLNSKKLTDIELHSEFVKLRKYKPKLTSRCFAGNAILYHYQLDNLCKVKTASGSFYDVMADETKRQEWWEKINKYANGSRPNEPALRMFEIYRRCTGAVVFFKPTIAMNIYHQVNATHVLDPTAGWGGRLLGAMAMDISYTGIDTNTNMKPAYDGFQLLEDFTIGNGDYKMIWDDALKVDFSTIDYDCVLTSPPYINLEIYENMTPYESKRKFYTDFLIPLITKCRQHIRRNGKVCFNISPKMYDELLVAGYEKCKEQIPMLQQKVRGKDKADMVYVW